MKKHIAAQVAAAALVVAGVSVSAPASADRAAHPSNADKCENLRGHQYQTQRRVVWRWKVRTPEAGDCRRIEAIF